MISIYELLSLFIPFHEKQLFCNHFSAKASVVKPHSNRFLIPILCTHTQISNSSVFLTNTHSFIFSLSFVISLRALQRWCLGNDVCDAVDSFSRGRLRLWILQSCWLQSLLGRRTRCADTHLYLYNTRTHTELSNTHTPVGMSIHKPQLRRNTGRAWIFSFVITVHLS